VKNLDNLPYGGGGKGIRTLGPLGEGLVLRDHRNRPPAPSGPREEVTPRQRDPEFESPSLRQGVCLTGAFHGYRRKRPGFAGSLSLDGTREPDGLATSRLALAAFL
jgi:hypothetical protein